MASHITPNLVEFNVVKHDTMVPIHKGVKRLEVKSIQPHADDPPLTDSACISLELMENLPQTTNTLKPDPLIMVFAELSMAMDAPFDAFHPPDTAPLDTSPLDTYDPKKPCYLFIMPRELRDTVYDLVISSGNLSILQTSKIVREESTEVLYKRRIYHLNIHFAKYVPLFSLQKPIASLIQNVKIEINLSRKKVQRFYHNIKQIRKFSGSIPRQTCGVVTLFKPWGRTIIRKTGVIAPEYNLLMSYIRTLIGFSQLIIEFRIRGAYFHFFGWNPLYTTILEESRQELTNQLGPST